MSESSAVEVGMPTTVPACRSLSTGGAGGLGGGLAGSGAGAGADPHFSGAGDTAPPSSGSERLSRSGSTSVMSVSEFYGPSGARMLQRRSSTASQLSLADSYGEGETVESASATKENREGQAALSSLMAAGAEGDRQQQQVQQQQQQQQAAGIGVGTGVGGVAQFGSAAAQAPLPAAATPGAWPALSWPSGQQQTFGAEALPASGLERGAAPGQAPQAPGAPPSSLPEAVVAPSASVGTPAAATTGLATAVSAGPHSAGPGPAGVSAEEAAASGSGGSPPPLTLDAPHPGAATDHSRSTTPFPPAAAACGTPTVPGQPRPAGGGGGGPASSLSLPWISGQAPSAAAAQPRAGEEPMPEDAGSQQNQRVGHLRAMSVDSAPSPARPHARTLSFAGGGGGSERGHGGRSGSKSGPEASGMTVQVPGGGNGSAGRSSSGGGGGGGPTVHSPRLRAQSMDSGGRKGKSKRGKGPGSAVMGKADRIGRMLQVSCCRIWGRGVRVWAGVEWMEGRGAVFGFVSFASCFVFFTAGETHGYWGPRACLHGCATSVMW